MSLIEQALHLIESGKVEEGLVKLDQLVQTADHDIQYTIANIYRDLGHIEKAKKIIDELLMFYPEEGTLFVYAAELMIDLDEEDEAIELLLEIEDDDEAFLTAQLLLADLYQMQSLDEVAERRLLLAAEKAPDEPIISHGLGIYYLDRGDYLKSIPYLKKAVHTNDGEEIDPNLFLYLAEAYSASGQFEDAMQYYERGLAEKVDLHSLLGYGFTAFQLRDFVVAIEQLEQLKQLDPEFSSLYPLLARAYEASEKLDKAMETLLQGLAVDEFNEQLYVHAGKLSFKRQQPSEGEQYLRQVIALNPANIEAIHTLAAYLKHEERFDDLLELITHVKQYDEMDDMLLFYEAIARKEMDEFDEAHALFTQIAHVFHEDIEFLEAYGLFLLEFGDRAGAERVLANLLQIDPDRHDIASLFEED